MNPVFKGLHHTLFDRLSCWYPFLAVYYLTYRCNFRCPYCSNGFNQPYHHLADADLSGDSVLEILRRVRRNCAHLAITGGEPLLHADARRVLERVGALGFKTLALNTKGYLADEFLPAIAARVDTLIISLDTLDTRKADAWFGKGPGTLARILDNIEATATYRWREFGIVISAVVTPGNIEDLYEVYQYARQPGFVFAACPELRGVYPAKMLIGNDAYRRFFDFLIGEKMKGRMVFGLPLYLEQMRDFRKFRCHLFTLLVVDPGGQVFYPCLEIGHLTRHLLHNHDLHAIRANACKHLGPQPDCDTRCHRHARSVSRWTLNTRGRRCTTTR